MNKILIKSVCKTYDQFHLIIPELTIDQGERVAFVGRNGSGKSTAIKLISGLNIQDKGTIDVFGHANSSRNVKDMCKFVLESGKGYYEYLTAFQNIEYFLALNHIRLTSEENETVFYTLVKKFEFNEHLHKKVEDLSQGNRQKMSIIVALMTNPTLLCLDEPTNGLDIYMLKCLIEQIIQFSSNGTKTILFTSHDLKFIQAVSTHVIYLDDGRIVRNIQNVDSLFDKLKKNKYMIHLEPSKKIVQFLSNYENYQINEMDRGIVINTFDERLKSELLKCFSVVKFETKAPDMEDFFNMVT